MAEKLIKYYAYVSQKAGLGGKIQLAAKTLTPSTKAAFEPDSKENIEKFKKAVAEITGNVAPDF